MGSFQLGDGKALPEFIKEYIDTQKHKVTFESLIDTLFYSKSLT